MADDRSQTGRPSWRGKPKPDRRERQTKTEKSSYEWAKRGTRPAIAGQPPRSRGGQLLISLFSFAVCLAIVVWLIWMINPPRPAGVVLLGADYANNLAVPHNALGYQGLTAIEQLSRTPKPWTLFNPARLELLGNPRGQSTVETADDWDELITALKKGFGEPTLIFVLALHGGSDASGAYLMPNRMKRPEDRLDMRKLISSMKDLPDAKTKILVVEGAQVESDWRLGILHNDFARQLKALEPEIRSVPNLWVLSGCDEDQRCWASEGLGQTIFMYFITEALRGGSAAGSDGRLSLEELYKYVRENVRRWAWTARGAVQEPVLLPGHSVDGGASNGANATASKLVRHDPATVHLATVEAAPPGNAPAPPDREVLSQAWRRFRQLDAMVPHPSAYSPLRWRAYGATLVRYEQLLLAGATESAQPVGEQLTQLEQAIRKDRVLTGVGSSAGVNLVMDALNGAAPAPPEPPEFLKIHQAGDDLDAQKIWDTLREGVTTGEDGGGQARPLRCQLAEYLLRRAQDDPVKDMRRAADRTRLTGLAGEPLPAETHFLRMLQGKLTPRLESRQPAFWKLAGQALRVRTLAERAAMGVVSPAGEYPHCELVRTWTRQIVEDADNLRRTGEDRLFAADETAWDLARQDLETAETGYRKAMNQAAEIHSALAVRDRAFAILLTYSQWLVNRHPHVTGDELAGRVETLWGKAHELSEILSRAREPATIAPVAHELDSGLGELVQLFVRDTESIAKDRLREDWESESAAAAVTFPDDEKLTRRNAIWDRLERIRLHDVEVARSPLTTPQATETSDPNRATEPAHRAALQGILALSALGKNWFGHPDFKDQDQGDYRNTLERLRALPARATDAGPWWQEATRQGDRIGLRFRALRGRVDSLADEGPGITDFAAFESRLSEADTLARLVDRAEDPPSAADTEPSSRYRQARVHDLLLWMANRAWLDHWYSEDPTAPPYYHAIVARLCNDAQGLFPELRDADQKIRERLDAPGRLTLENKDRLVVTSELAVSAEFRVVDESGSQMVSVPPGIPVIRPLVSGPLALADSSAEYHAVTRDSKAKSGFELTSPTMFLAESRASGFDALLANPASRRAGLNFDGFFRGQAFSHQTVVDLQVVPDLVAIGPAPPDPPRASVAVRASDEIIRQFGEGTGSIAVVLDCSGSMRFDGDRSKWPNAKKALKRVLKESVPKGTRLSLWTFSQLAEGIPVDADGHLFRGANIDADNAEPERTIIRQRPMAPWEPTQADEVSALLDRLNPYFHTPLVEAMERAATSDLIKARGLKNLLVLTDGADDRFKQSRALNPEGRLEIPEFLVQRFRSRGIRITVVYFRSSGLEADEKKAEEEELRVARKNFEEPLQKLELPGQFIEAKDVNQLIDSLRAGLEQKLVCQILKADKTPADDEPLDVTQLKADLPRWWTAGLDSGFYTLRVPADRLYDQGVVLKGGDRLMVDLVDDGNGGIAFRRAIYGDDEDFQGAEKKVGGDWRLTILGNQKAGDKTAGLGLMAAIESTLNSGTTLVQDRPGWVAFRLTGEGLKDPSSIALRWRERMTYPAPVWQLDVPRWPADPAAPGSLARPILTAWWLDRDQTRKLTDVNAEFGLDPAGFPFDVPLANGQVVQVEDFQLENHYVEVKPGELPRSQPCLVIRLAYPKDSPYFIDPDSLGSIVTTGHEHRYYSGARKYAGLFWPVNIEQVNLLRKSKFRIVSLNRLRDEAAKHGQKVEIKLERPADNVKLPEPPRAIRR